MEEGCVAESGTTQAPSPPLRQALSPAHCRALHDDTRARQLAGAGSITENPCCEPWAVAGG